ncbi:vitamin K epoxide reductase family protein [Williamsia sp.]|uniref:vitamin K epoxide reductase family protein n=1 Tax=Williamsia sp. TaxID=1872085 RepID=UPI002F949F93
MTDVSTGDAPSELFPRLLPWILGICGVVGLVASFTLTVEKFELASNPDYVPSCSISPVLNCGSIMDTDQAAVFGFPNSLLGITGFAALLTIAVMMGRKTSALIMLGMQVGLTAGVAFIGWLIFQSLYRIDALCPYCMVVWVVTIVAFWYVTLRNADDYITGGTPRKILNGVLGIHSLIPVVVMLAIVGLILEHFWWYWSTLV